jgi:hypothetical protein
MKTYTSTEIVQAHTNLQHAIAQFDRYKRSLCSDVECLRNQAARVEEYRKNVPVDSTESTDTTSYVELAEQHICDCFNGTAVNSPKPANFKVGMYRKPGAGVSPATGENEEKLSGTGGLQKF